MSYRLAQRPVFRWTLCPASWFAGALVMASLVGSQGGAQERVPDPLGVDEALRMRDFLPLAPLSLSPDERLVAFTVWEVHRQPRLAEDFSTSGAPRTSLASDVWIADTESGENRNLTAGQGTSWGPVWSPDGSLLAFYSDREGRAQIWLWERTTGRLRRASTAVVRPFFAFETVRWSADGRHLVSKLWPDDQEPSSADTQAAGGGKPVPSADNAASATVVVYAAPGGENVADTAALHTVEYGNRFLSDLGVIDVRSGDVRRVVRRRHITGYWLSPAGTEVAFTALRGQVARSSHSVVDELGVAAVREDRQPRVIVPAIHRGLHFPFLSWSPDGRRLAFVADGAEGAGDCFVAEVQTGTVRNLTIDAPTSFASDFRAPVWDPTGRHLYLLSADTVWRLEVASGSVAPAFAVPGREIVAMAASPAGSGPLILLLRDPATQRMGFARGEISSGEISQLFEDSRFLGGTFAVVAGSRKFVYTSQGAQHGPDLWVADTRSGERRQVTHINPSLHSHRFGETRLVEWNSLDGQPLKGALLLPAGYREGARYPLILVVYGGSLLSNRLHRFGLIRGAGVDNLQLLATRGYAVLTPDAPLRPGTPIEDLVKTVLPAVNRVVELGIADGNRVGIMGHSYGGYSTIALLTRTDRFRAAVSRAAQSNLVGQYGALTRTGFTGVEWAETGQGRMGVTPWQNRAIYIENSPFFYLDRVQTPLLLIHGSEDETVPVFLADQTFVALRRLGKEVVYAKYMGEAHWEGQWSYANARDYLQRMLSWFEEHLQPESVRPGS